MTESIDDEYINISIHDQVERSSYIKFPFELRNSKKGLINIQSKDNVFVGVTSDI